MAGARSPPSKKKPKLGWGGARPVRGPGGSSFLECPGCGKSLHAARLPFHKLECSKYAGRELGMTALQKEGLPSHENEDALLKPSVEASGALTEPDDMQGQEPIEGAIGLSRESERPGSSRMLEPKRDGPAGHTGSEAQMSADVTAVAGVTPAVTKEGGGQAFNEEKEATQAGVLERATMEKPSGLDDQSATLARERDEWQTQMLERDSEVSGLAAALMQAKGQLADAAQEIEGLKRQLADRDQEVEQLRAFKRKVESEAQALGALQDNTVGGSPPDLREVSKTKPDVKELGPITPIQLLETRAQRVASHRVILEPPQFGSPGEPSPESRVHQTAAAECQTNVGGVSPQGSATSQDSGAAAAVGAWERVGALLEEAEKGQEGGDNRGEQTAQRARQPNGTAVAVDGQPVRSGSPAGGLPSTDAAGDDSSGGLHTRGRKRGRKVLDDDSDAEAAVAKRAAQGTETGGEAVRRQLFGQSSGSDDDETLLQRQERKAQEQGGHAVTSERGLGRLRKVGGPVGGQVSGKQLGAVLQVAEEPMGHVQLRRSKRGRGSVRAGAEGARLELDEIEESEERSSGAADSISEESTRLVEEGDGSDVGSDAEDESISGGGDGSLMDDSEGGGGSGLAWLFKRARGPAEWQSSADMLAAMGKDDLLCMKGLCAVYRRQTRDEQIFRKASYRNDEGFSKVDAERASLVASFLTEDNPSGPVVKNAKQLEAFDRGAVEKCRDWCYKYASQLFEIVKARYDSTRAERRDPHFP